MKEQIIIVMAGLLVAFAVNTYRLYKRIDDKDIEINLINGSLEYMEHCLKSKQRDILTYQSRIHNLEHEVDGVMRENEMLKNGRTKYKQR